MKKKWKSTKALKKVFCYSKPFLIMRITVFLLLFSVIQVMGESSYSQNKRLSLNFKDASIENVLDEIESQSEFYFLFNQKLVNVDRKVDINTKNKRISDILDDIFAGEDVNCLVIDRQILLSPEYMTEAVNVTRDRQPQEIVVTGKVTDEDGNSIPGVNIVIKGTITGTITGADGNYSIEVDDPNATLVFSFVGMRSQEVVVGSQTTINIEMAVDEIGIGEVVAVGYGTQRKRDVTGAMASYSADNIQERGVIRVDQALVGQMAGVQVKQTSGVLGSGFSIQVRGAGSISAGNEPLYVIDGFPLATTSPNASGSFNVGNPLDNINPSDIESIQVLKDAASASIYGSRAANGVVIITTKQGKKGEPKISLNISSGFSEASRKLELLNTDQFIDRATEMINAMWVASGSGRTSGQTTEERRQILGLGEGLVNTDYMLDDRWAQPGYGGLHAIDWQDEMFRKGLVQNYQISASGANEKVKYYFSGNYSKQEGMIINMDYTNYSARANVEVKASNNLTLGIKLAPSFSIGNDPGIEGKNSLLHHIVSLSPIQEDLPENVNVFDYHAYKWLIATSQLNSPITKSKYTIGQTKRIRTLASIFADYQIAEGLVFKITANLDNTDNNIKSYIPYTVMGTLTRRQLQPGVSTSGSFNTYRKQSFVNENTLSYNKVIDDIHNLSVVTGASYNSNKLETASLNSLNGFGNPVINTLNAASAITGNTFETKDVLISFFGRAQYSFNDKYLITSSIRRDGSSRFGTNTRYGWFPSASVGWRVTNENFMSNVKLINDLKLRISWGKSGNYNIGDYSSIPLLGTSNCTFNNALAYGQVPISITNPNLSWETSKTVDFGFDISLLKNRISASFDYYNKLNQELLLNVPIPRVTGFPSSLSNIGKVRNKGWEVEIVSHNMTSDFQWTTSLNLSHNANKVVSLAGGQKQILIPSKFDISHSILEVGQPMYSINVVRQIGILSKEDIANNVALYGNQKEGDPKYFDYNKDGMIDANDRVIVGHPNPDYIWGVKNSFKYKGFDLEILVQGQSGGSIYSLFGRSLNRTGMVFSDNTLATYNDRWRSAENPGAGEVGKAYSTFGRIKNTDWLWSSDYLRVRNITLGYDLNTLLKSINARMYITAENFFGYDKYKGGYNPEAANTDLSGNSLYPEAGDYGGLPLPRSLILGLNINF